LPGSSPGCYTPLSGGFLQSPESQIVALLREIIKQRKLIQAHMEGELKQLRHAAELSYNIAADLVVKGA
jgi:hypothetical protein